jgi:hypothetical protein
VAHAVPSVRVPQESVSARLLAVAPELLVAAATLLALVLGVYELDRRALWRDETTTFYVSGVPWPRLAELLATGAEGWHPPTYFVALKLWRVLGDSQVVLRSMSVLFAVLSVPALYLAGRRLTESRWVPAVAALLLACNAFFVSYAQEARAYSLTMFLAIASTWLFLRALETQSTRRWAIYGVVALLGIYAHVFFALVVFGHYLAFLLPGMWPRLSRVALGTLAAIGLLTIPLVLASVAQTGTLVNWIPPVRWATLWNAFFQFAGGALPVVVAYAACALIALAWAVTHPKEGWSRIGFVLLWLLVPPLGLAAASLLKPLFVNRYVIVSLPALTLLVALGIGRLPRVPAAATLAVVVLASASAVSAGYTAQYKPWDWLATHLADQGTERDGLVLWSEPTKVLSAQVVRFGLADEMPELAWPWRDWSHNPYESAVPPTMAPSDALAECRYERVWLVRDRGDFVAPDETNRELVYRVLTTAYTEETGARRSGIHVELLVRNDQPCPAP